MKTQPVLLQWIDSTVGGRKMAVPFSAHPYCVPSKFQGWQSEMWSLCVMLFSSFDQRAGLYRGEVWFLADNAPVEVLKTGAQFALYEGTRIVAVGMCI